MVMINTRNRIWTDEDEHWRDFGGKKKKKLDKITAGRLEHAFSIGCNIKQACEFAGISTVYYYSQIDKSEYLSKEKIEGWRERPKILAKQRITEGLNIEGNHEFALKYLERVSPEEFSTKQINESKIIVSLDSSQIDKVKEVEMLENTDKDDF